MQHYGGAWGRNWTAWCPHCECYRSMNREDRSRCAFCDKRFFGATETDEGCDEEEA
jgi:hypothetical protein